MQNSTFQAPAGGMVSTVNGQFYAGGSFMPTHGLFCGKVGQKRKALWDASMDKGKAIDLGGSKMFSVLEYAGNSSWIAVCVVISDTEKEAVNHAKSVFNIQKSVTCNRV